MESISSMENPALRSELRYEPATVVPLRQNISIVEWLEERDRFRGSPTDETSKLKSKESKEEIYDDLMVDDSIIEDEETTDDEEFE